MVAMLKTAVVWFWRSRRFTPRIVRADGELAEPAIVRSSEGPRHRPDVALDVTTIYLA